MRLPRALPLPLVSLVVAGAAAPRTAVPTTAPAPARVEPGR
ncbi:hypothetical protein ACFV6G_23130 [Streptomyces lavendulae]